MLLYFRVITQNIFFFKQDDEYDDADQINHTHDMITINIFFRYQSYFIHATTNLNKLKVCHAN